MSGQLRAGLCLSLSLVAPAIAQVDQARASAYFAEARTLCERDDGKLWGVSLCGPMVFADAATRTRATNRDAPEAPAPPTLGYVNAPAKWGEDRWAAYVWSMLPADDAAARGRMLVHELFHRVQTGLGLMLTGPPNDHLDTLDGRYWIQLEWRALSRALESSGVDRGDAVREALAFRATRRSRFPEAGERERIDELREGLAQYTGTVLAFPVRAEAIRDGIRQLGEAAKAPTFVRTFSYASGSAYGLLLDEWAPGWTRRLRAKDDLGMLLAEAGGLTADAALAESAAPRYGAARLRAEEEERRAKHEALVAELRKRFVDGPIVIVPRGRGAVVNTTGVTSIPGAGSVFFSYRLSAEWGELESTGLLESSDGKTLRLPAPFRREGDSLKGDGWTIRPASGWSPVPGARAGDFELARADNTSNSAPSIVGARTIAIADSDGEITADLYGAGEHAVVLLHGGRFDRSSWKPQAEVLAARGFRVLALDFRAAVASRAGKETPCLYDPVCLAKDVLAAVRYLRRDGARSVSIVGGSLGGGAAAQATIEAPDGEIDRIVLLAHMSIPKPEGMRGRKLFVAASGDLNASGRPRLEAIRDQYNRAPEPKRLLVVEGSAHAQFLFETDPGKGILEEIVRFLSEP